MNRERSVAFGPPRALGEILADLISTRPATPILFQEQRALSHGPPQGRAGRQDVAILVRRLYDAIAVERAG